MTIKFGKPSWIVTLVSLPFLAVGLIFLFFSVIPTLYLGITASFWVQVPANLLSASLDVNNSGDGTTQRALARYQYEYQGQSFTSDRIGISRGSDNIGVWHSRVSRELQQALAENRPVTALVNPNDPAVAILYSDIRWRVVGLKMIFVVIFGGVGTLLFVGSFLQRSNALARLHKAGNKVKQEAQSDHIYSSARSSFWVLLATAVIVNVIGFAILFAVGDQWHSGNIAVFAALIFPIAGFVLTIITWRTGYQLWKIGRSPLIMVPFPAGLGGHLGATVLINSKHDSEQRFKVSLSCIHRYTNRSGSKSQTTEVTRWHEQGLAYVERAAQNKTQLRFNFNIPKDLPATSSDGTTFCWRVDIEGQVATFKYKRSFRVPVLAVETPTPARRYLATEHPGMLGLAFERIAALKIHDGINEFEAQFPRFSYLGERLGGITFGAIFLCSGVGAAIAGAPFVFPLLFVPIGGAIAGYTLVGLLTAQWIKVTADGVSRRSSLIGLVKKSMHFAKDDIDSIGMKPALKWESTTGPKRYFFCIEAKNNRGQKLKLIERIEGEATAQTLIDRFNEILKRTKT